MTRCYFCRHIVWPWQRKGWLVGRATWHARCYAVVPFRELEEPDGV